MNQSNVVTIDSVIEAAGNQTRILSVIRNLDSSLRQRILGSAAFTLGGKAVTLVEKIDRANVAEAKYGRRAIDRNTGEPMVDSLRVELEEMLAVYGSVMDAGGPEVESFANLEAVVSARETPYVKALSDEQLRIRSQLSGKSTEAIRQEAYKVAESKAEQFSRRAGSILGELESALAFAPMYDFEDITESQWDAAEACRRSIAKYRAAVAAGKIWDDSDMLLALEDIKTLEKLI
jgi:hypothetical protein